jgi:hypothetical protein
MKAHAAITVHRSREEVEQRWRDWQHRPSRIGRATVRITDAPADRGTEIHVVLERNFPGGPLGEIVGKLAGGAALGKLKDDLRRFKQQIETGEITRSDAAPEGELAERKFKRRPAQPLPQREKAGVS